jgi:hypothetical protein
MSAIQAEPESVGIDEVKIAARTKSAASTLIDLCVGLIHGNDSDVPGMCSRCLSKLGPRSSTAKFPNTFCSEQCEREFIRASLASMTLDDCVRMHARLDVLLDRAQKHVS